MNDPILSLRVARFNDEPVAEPTAVEFGPAGGTIGRATDCTLVLPDQQRAISRVHARIEFRGGEYLLCDLGSNPSVLNQRALGGTREARLANGDRLVIGTYLLEVTIAERVAGVRSVTGLSDPLAAVKVLGGPLPADGQGDPFGLGSLDPLGQPAFGERAGIASGPRYAGSESDHVAPEFQAFSAPVAAPRAPASAPPIAPGAATPSSSGIPADYDPLADVLAQWEKPAQPGGVPAGAAHTSPLFAPSPSAPSNASAFTSNFAPAQALAPQVPASQNGPTGLPQSLLDDPVGGAATPFDDLLAPAAAPLIPEDLTEIAPASSLPDAAPSARVAPAPAPAQPAVQQPSPTQREPEPLPAAMAAPAPKATAPAPAVQPEPAPPRAAVPNGDTFAALLEGLGLDPSRAPNLPPAELARLVGMMLREALRGTMAVLRARSMTRREARLDVTLIVARDNNPLKFFPDVDSALAQMLTGRGAGYLPPAEALERAFDDIESHELAVIVGMRAGLAEVLGRFDPASIEAQLKAGGVIDKVLSNRKAKLWDLFVDRQADVSREAEDDFQRLFGKAFNDAYEAQIDALHAARKSGNTDPTSHH
ncbi:UNVERIFIED_ORG: FHA domain protein [Burkholderia sp. CF145]|uniref:type VI secretion system-associated FHA domain protein TagH n=1 Tax=Paraburkholderia hospita TaxID=169430 RepID=UPI000271ADF4|nr:type VI secretion system-associated FHA domain protein TagH [Paraburkholderia hospita]EUC16954.1 FHA domain containing protein [Burkholderia sp. BT03]SKD03619.1 FHA domain protein [Paraburkholderia hospita]